MLANKRFSVINKEYKSIENKIANDRDRNAFGGDLMKLFYRTFVKNMKYSIDANRTIVEAARECWERGHPLLSEIAEAARYRSTKIKNFLQRLEKLLIAMVGRAMSGSFMLA